MTAATRPAAMMLTVRDLIALTKPRITLMVLVTVAFTRALGTLRTVKLEPERVDDTPIMRCQECGSTWIEDTPPIHEGPCAVAYVKDEDRRTRS